MDTVAASMQMLCEVGRVCDWQAAIFTRRVIVHHTGPLYALIDLVVV